LNQHLQAIRAFGFPWAAMSTCVLLLLAAIISRTQLIEERRIPTGKPGLANGATDLNQESQFFMF
jgi:hypothetical protein